jgi:hypothetical protein
MITFSFICTVLIAEQLATSFPTTVKLQSAFNSITTTTTATKNGNQQPSEECLKYLVSFYIIQAKKIIFL